MRKFILLFLAAFCLVFVSSQAYASSTKIVAEGRYILGDNDTRTQAKDAAVKDAMRIAVEKAGVYVETPRTLEDDSPASMPQDAP